MQLYQFWWDGLFGDGETGGCIAHNNVFTKDELVQMINESGETMCIDKLEEFLIEHKGFYRPNCIRIDTFDSVR